jgi:hypothetical protein
MRHAAARAQGGLGEHGLDHFVGVQAAFHQHLDLAARSHAGGQLCRCVAVLYRVNLHPFEVDARLGRHGADARLGAHEHRHDQAVACRVHGTAQRARIARVHHGAAHGGHAVGQRQQLLEARLGVKQLDLRCIHLGNAHLGGGRQHAGRAVQHALALLVDHRTVEFDAFFLVVLARHGHRHGERVANAHRLGEMQHLLQINGAGARKLRAQQRRDECAAPHAVGDDAVKQRVVGVFGVEVGRVGVARDGGKGLDVGLREGAQQARALAHAQFVVGDVFNCSNSPIVPINTGKP